MTLAGALEADEAGRLVDAAELYEGIVTEPRPPLIALLNVALLYWQATDYGYWTTKGLPLDFVKRAGLRFPEILSLAQKLYPTSTEARFWSMYINWIDLGEHLSSEDCLALLREDPTSLAPALFLASQDPAGAGREEAKALVIKSRESATTLGRYVVSTLESALNRLSLGVTEGNPHRLDRK